MTDATTIPSAEDLAMTSCCYHCQMFGAVDGLVTVLLLSDGRPRNVDWVSNSSPPVLSVTDLNVILEVIVLKDFVPRGLSNSFDQNLDLSFSKTDFS